MGIDQLALLLALVLAANLILLVALELPRIGRRSRRGAAVGRDATEAAPGQLPAHAPPTGQADDSTYGPGRGDGPASALSAALYQRVVRVVSFMFIGAVLVVASVTAANDGPGIYVLLALGAFLIILFQDILPPTSLGRWRLPIESASAIGFLTALLVLTGGHNSPYFFGYILLLGAASLWATGVGPPVLAILTSAAYIVGVLLAPSATSFETTDFGRVAFNLVALALVTYVAAVIGREQRRAREEALRLSRFDSLTALHARDYFLSEVEQEILRASRSGRPFALLMLDLDGLKAANDRFGHASGDQLLRGVADVLRGDIRVTDVAARYGGDEFVLLLPETDVAGAVNVADKLRVDISRLALPNDGAVIRTSASIGLVTFPDDGRTSIELMRRADLAMYEAKRRGRDQVVRYAREVGVPIMGGAASGGGRQSAANNQPRAGPPPLPVGPAVPSPSPGPPPWETTGG